MGIQQTKQNRMVHDGFIMVYIGLWISNVFNKHKMYPTVNQQ